MVLECVDQDETEPSNMSCHLFLDGDHSEISRDRMPAHRVAGNSNWSMCDRVVPSVFSQRSWGSHQAGEGFTGRWCFLEPNLWTYLWRWCICVHGMNQFQCISKPTSPAITTSECDSHGYDRHVCSIAYQRWYPLWSMWMFLLHCIICWCQV